jgi:hypothetical protein
MTTTKRFSLIKLMDNWNIQLTNLLYFGDDYRYMIVYDENNKKFEKYKITGDMEYVTSKICNYSLSEINEKTKDYFVITDKDILAKLKLLCIKYRKY